MQRIPLEEEIPPALVQFLEKQILTLNHTPEYINEIKKKCSKVADNASVSDHVADVYYTRQSYEAALLAVLAAIRGVQTIMGVDVAGEEEKENKPKHGKLKRGYCITRPPGHHSKCGDAAGFCIFNNVALAAKYARNFCKRVCVFDWDIHHGDGTQQAFYEDDSVLFISMHRCDGLTFYPYNQAMKPEYIGKNKG